MGAEANAGLCAKPGWWAGQTQGDGVARSSLRVRAFSACFAVDPLQQRRGQAVLFLKVDVVYSTQHFCMRASVRTSDGASEAICTSLGRLGKSSLPA